MARTEQTDIFISRLLALVFSVVSAACLLTRLSGYSTILAAAIFACLSVLVLGIIRSRAGVQNTYSHPLSVITLVLLCPAIGLILLSALLSLFTK